MSIDHKLCYSIKLGWYCWHYVYFWIPLLSWRNYIKVPCDYSLRFKLVVYYNVPTTFWMHKMGKKCGIWINLLTMALFLVNAFRAYISHFWFLVFCFKGLNALGVKSITYITLQDTLIQLINKLINFRALDFQDNSTFYTL